MDYRPKNLRSTVLLGAAAFLSALLRSVAALVRARSGQHLPADALFGDVFEWLRRQPEQPRTRMEK